MNATARSSLPTCPRPCVPPLADKHYSLAQQLYSSAIEADPTNAVLWANRAFAAIRLEVHPGRRAVAWFHSCLVPALLHLLCHLLYSDVILASLEDTAVGLETCVDPSFDHRLLHATLSRLQEFGGAIADAGKALELDPQYAKAYYRRGDASFALGHFKDAVRDFRAAIRLAPGDPDLRRKVPAAAAAACVCVR